MAIRELRVLTCDNCEVEAVALQGSQGWITTNIMQVTVYGPPDHSHQNGNIGGQFCSSTCFLDYVRDRCNQLGANTSPAGV